LKFLQRAERGRRSFSAYVPPKSLIRRGHAVCDAAGVPIARHFTELIVWQLGDALRVEILKITRRAPVVGRPQVQVAA
jgi:hypothetical protein